MPTDYGDFDLHLYRAKLDDSHHLALVKGKIDKDKPTLVLNARNDPFIPAASLPTRAEVSATVMLEQPEGGGHAGFLSAPFPGRLDWLPLRLVQFFEAAQKHPEAHVVPATR